MINKYRRTVNRELEKASFWPCFTDLIATVLMVVILMLFSYQSLSGSVEQDLAKNIQESVTEILDESKMPISIDENTAMVTFGENALFDTDSDELKPQAKNLLKSFIPVYIEALYTDYGDVISKIIITGHTDDVGSYLYNLDLSQRRALSVAKFIVGDEIGDYKYKEKVIQDVEAVGRSKAELIENPDGTVNRDASRRVEISYEIKID